MKLTDLRSTVAKFLNRSSSQLRMTDQVDFMPTRFGTAPGSAEFEAVAKQFGVDIKTLAKTDEESLKGLSIKMKEDIDEDVFPGRFTKESETIKAAVSFVDEMYLDEERKLINDEYNQETSHQSSHGSTKGISPRASSFKNSNFQTKRRFSSPGRLSKVFQGLSLTEGELLEDGKSEAKRKSVGHRNYTTISSSKGGNVAEKKRKFGKQVGLATKEGYNLSHYNADDTTKARQKFDSNAHEDTLRKSSDSKKEASNNLTLSNRVTVNSEVVPIKGRNMTSSLVSNVFPKINGDLKSHELSTKVGRKGLSRRMSHPLISQSTLGKSALSLLSRKNSGSKQSSDQDSKNAKPDAGLIFRNSMKVDNVRDSLLSRRNSRLETSTSRNQINEVNSEKYNLCDSRNCDAGKNGRSRKLSLPASFYHSVEKKSAASKNSDDSGNVFLRKTVGRKSFMDELVKLDDELPHNLGNNVNPEHIFRLWNVKLPKQLANELKIELTQNKKER